MASEASSAAADGVQRPARRDLRAELSAFGEFIAVDTHDAASRPEPPWLPLAALVDSPRLFDDRVAAVRAALGARLPGGPGEVEERVAASVTHLGIAARVLAPWIVASALGVDRPAFRLEELWWQDVPGGAVPLSCSDEPLRTGRPAVAALTEFALARYGLGPRVAWGNAASAANGAVTTVSRRRPDLVDAARAVADRVLLDPRLDGGILRSGPGFRRRSCCLIYRVAGTTEAVCGDCVLGA